VRVVVTGGAGFIGANLCRRLALESAIVEVVAFDDLSTGSRKNLEGVDPKIKLVVATLLDRDDVDATVDGADAIVHLAARPSVPRSLADPVATHRVNVDGTVNVLEAARGLSRSPRFVFASSSSVYGANPTMPKTEDLVAQPRSPYAASKLSGESYALAYQESFGLPVLAFRFFNVFGPLQTPGHAYAAVVPAFIHAALLDEPLPVHGDGLQIRDFTFVDTVTDVITRAVLDGVTSPTPVNLAFGTRSTLLDVIAIIEQLLGKSVERNHLPVRAGDVRESQASNARLRQLFPDVSPVGLAEGLKATVAWMQSVVV